MAPRVAIVGAGPVGLCLARILQQNSIDTTVFEGETSSSARAQGGCLDLHPPTGQEALKRAGLWYQFQKYARYDGQALRVGDRHGKMYINLDENTDTGRPEIDRKHLRKILLESIDPATVKWGHQVASADPDAGTIYFRDGSSKTGFDLIVGADGAWSKIRPLLTYFSPHYCAMAAWDFRIADVDTRYPELGALVGRGSLFMFGEEKRQTLTAQRQSDGSIHAYAMSSYPESEVGRGAADVSDPAAVRAKLLKEFSPNWDSKYLQLIELADDEEMVLRPLYQLPVGVRWVPRRGVTLVGDAAHLQSPYTGEGVNLGFTDALKLAEAIMRHGDDMFAAIQQYEKEMEPQWRESTSRTWDVFMANFEPGFAEKFAKNFGEIDKEEGYAKIGEQAKTKV